MPGQNQRSDAALRAVTLFREKEVAAADRYQDQARLRKEKTAVWSVLSTMDSEMRQILAESDDVETMLWEATGFRLSASGVSGTIPLSSLFSGKLLKAVVRELEDMEDAHPATTRVGILIRVEGRKGLAVVTRPGIVDQAEVEAREKNWRFCDMKGGIDVVPLSMFLPEKEEEGLDETLEGT